MLGDFLLDEWESDYIKNLKDKDVLCWSDAEVVYKWPKYKWVYDKFILHKYLNEVPTWDLWEKIPKRYPKFVKPRINLQGMGKFSGIVHSFEEILEDGLCGTHIAQSVLEGCHISTDLVFDGEDLVDYFSFKCYKDENGSFWLFESTKIYPKRLIKKLSKIGEGRRVINIETIGGKPLEVHMRPSLQFYDICGGLIKQLPEFIKTGKWTKIPFEKTYSRVYRRNTDTKYLTPRYLPVKSSNICSVQLCWEPYKALSDHEQDPHSYRYMVINGKDLEEIEKYSEKVHKLLKESKYYTKKY